MKKIKYTSKEKYIDNIYDFYKSVTKAHLTEICDKYDIKYLKKNKKDKKDKKEGVFFNISKFIKK